jgi:hypothetical protein
MIRVRPTQPRFRRFHSFTILSLFPLVHTLVPGELTATAKSPFGLTPSKGQSLLAPSAITIPTRGLPVTHTQVPARSMSASEDFQNYAITMTTVSNQDPALWKAGIL